MQVYYEETCGGYYVYVLTLRNKGQNTVTVDFGFANGKPYNLFVTEYSVVHAKGLLMHSGAYWCYYPQSLPNYYLRDETMRPNYIVASVICICISDYFGGYIKYSGEDWEGSCHGWFTCFSGASPWYSDHNIHNLTFGVVVSTSGIYLYDYIWDDGSSECWGCMSVSSWLKMNYFKQGV